MNVKRVRRLYNLEGLQMRYKSSRRRVMEKLRDGGYDNAVEFSGAACRAWPVIHPRADENDKLNLPAEQSIRPWGLL